MEISAFSDGVVNNWNNTQPESAISAGDRIISVDGLQGDPELMLNGAQSEQQARYGIASGTLKTFQQVLHDGESEFERAMGES